MGFSLSNLFQYNSSTDSSTNKGTVLVGDSAKNYQVVSQIRNLLPGQNISGEVVGIHDNQIQIALDKDTVLTARLERNLNIALGQTLTFEVSSISNSQIALRPLFTNMSHNPNLLKALDAAKIPVNDSTISMVTTMMEEGMSIDKQSLQNIYRDVMTFSSSNSSSLVQLNQLNIPITEENIAQFENYKNNQHQMLNSIMDITKEIPLLFQELVKEGKEGDGVLLYQKLIHIFTLNPIATGTSKESLYPTNTLLNEVTNPTLDNVKVNGELLDIVKDQSSESLGLQNQPQTSVEEKVYISNLLSQMEQQSENKEDIFISKDEITLNLKTQDILSPRDRLQLATYLEQIGVSKDVTAMVKQGTLTPAQILSNVNQILVNTEITNSQGVKSLLGSIEFNEILKSEITRQWLLEPKDIVKNGSLGELYQKISQQTGKMMEELGQMTKSDSSLMKSLSNIQGNLDFMTQLNQMFTYVQLPLKLSRQNANGDLYVYTNKKNLAKDDGNISAFLHLEMDHIGTLDIYVKMQNKDVTTKFYLQDDATIDFINNHINILNQKLEKRGYNMTSEMVLREKDVNVIEEMMQMEDNKGNAPTLLSKYSFDVRA